MTLGHRRLAIIDLSPGGQQPMSGQAENVQIVLNGEIYNYRELRDVLRRKGHRFRSESDTEVLVRAYEQWGAECLERINGMFSFAIYDGRIGKLFLARDRVGEKPLFFYHADGLFAFASELKALLADRSIPRRLDPTALDHYLAYGSVPGGLCILAGISKLPPAHCLTYDIENDDIREWRYWSLPAPSALIEADPEPLVQQLDQLLGDAVSRQLVADVPVGVLLSGGVDSSLVTAVAARSSSKPIRTFTITFPGHGVYDETAHARLVASHFGTQHTELVGTSATVELLPRLARQFDEPIGDSSVVPTYIVSRLIREQCTVALGGDGGDELFGGYMHHSRVQRQMEFAKKVPAWAKKIVGKAAAVLPTGVRGRTYFRSLAFPPGNEWVGTTLLFDEPTRRGLAPYTRNVVGQLPEAYRKEAGGAGKSALQRMTTADFQTYLPDDILVKVDRASMLASLEVRAPFLDYRLVEFAFGKVPDQYRATSTDRKVLLRMLARRILPPQFDSSRKQGFSIPLQTWFSGDWGAYLIDVLRSAPATLYDPSRISRLIASQRLGFVNAQRLFNLAFLELWRRSYSVECPTVSG